MKSISIEELPKAEGEAQVEAMGGSVDVGDDYASNFLIINPQEKLTDGDKMFTVTMKVESGTAGTATVYKTNKNSKGRWVKVDAEINEGVAKMQVNEGNLILIYYYNYI